MKKIIISTVVVLSIAVAGYFIVDSQVVTESEKVEAAQKRKERTIKSRKHVLELHKSGLSKYKSQYEEDPSNMNALTLVTEKYWLIAETYKDLDKRLGRQPSTELIENNMQKSLQYLEEFDSKMSAGWNDPEFRNKNQYLTINLISFYHHIDKNIPRAVYWYKKYLNYLVTKWNGGQKDRETACWVSHIYARLATITRGANPTEGQHYQEAFNNWADSVMKDFPPKDGHVKQCNLPYY